VTGDAATCDDGARIGYILRCRPLVACGHSGYTDGMAKREPTYGVREAKDRLSELIGRVRYADESITITSNGRPVARLVPITDEGEEPDHAKRQRPPRR
jgi:prevent-host-death family protein